jgi:hypothetical protein
MTEFPEEESLELTKVAQYFGIMGGRNELYRELRSIFDQDYEPAAVHELLAQTTAPILVITTNYDDLIERAFAAEGREYDVVVHTTDRKLGNDILWFPYGQPTPNRIVPKKLNIDLGKTSVIYKMHGAVDRVESSRDQYVITEDDYIDFLTRMTKNQVIPAIFTECFETRSLLFLGYGLRDWNLRVVLNRIKNSRTSWAIQFEPSLLEQRFWQKRGVEVFDMRIEDFVRKLREY